MDCLWSRGRRGSLRDSSRSPLPACGLGGPGRSLLPTTGPVGSTRSLGVTVRSLDECARVCLAVVRPGVTSLDHMGPTTGCVTVDAGHVTARPFLLTVRGLGRGVAGLGRVAGITWRFRPPGIMATVVKGGACPCGGGQLHSPAHALFAGPHQVVPLPVGAL